MQLGCEAWGMEVGVFNQADWPALSLRQDLPDVAIFYGLEGNIPEIFREYRDNRRAAVYVDLGYWGRREGGRFTGYHKVVVNARHPTAYFRNVRGRRTVDRFARFKIQPKAGRYSQGMILLAGMGDKGAIAEGYDPEQWELETYQAIREVTDRPILYRPKPSWKTARPLPMMGYSPRTEEIPWPAISAVVTHHSNVAVEGLLEGIPTHCISGVASIFGGALSTRLVFPTVPSLEERLGWCQDIAYTQWSLLEMENGNCWRYLVDEQLL